MGNLLVYFVRHGATEANRRRPYVLQGSSLDLPLADEGILQAEQTSKHLRHVPLVAIYSSPLRRAVQTAEIIARPHGLPVTVIDELREVDVGRWEGMSYEEIARTYPEEFARFLENPAVHGYPGGETLSDVERRVTAGMRRVLEAQGTGTILVVWHNTVGRVYLAHLLGTSPSAARRFKLTNGGLSIVRYDEDGPAILLVNSVAHLEPSPRWFPPARDAW